jgi:hypothetical protein
LRGAGSTPFGYTTRPARSYEVEETLELVSAGQREHGVEASGSEPAQLVDGRRAARVDDRAGPERRDQARGCLSGRGRDHRGAPRHGELHRHRSHGAGSAEHEHLAPRPQAQGANAL